MTPQRSRMADSLTRLCRRLYF